MLRFAFRPLTSAVYMHSSIKNIELQGTAKSKKCIVTCVALAKAGLVVGPLRPSVRNTLGCQVCVICNSKSFYSFLFKLCLMIVHILKMCTFYFVHVS